eukprot:gene2497-1557_t
MTHSVDLQWTLVRQNSKFLQKRGGIRLSNDPFNNNGNWTKRQSGFLNDVAAVVKPGKKGAIVVTVKDGKSNNKPKQTFKKTSMAAGVKASAVSKAVAAVRPDLADLTFRRARKLAIINSRTAKVCAARKARSAGIKFARKSVRQSFKWFMEPQVMIKQQSNSVVKLILVRDRVIERYIAGDSEKIQKSRSTVSEMNVAQLSSSTSLINTLELCTENCMRALCDGRRNQVNRSASRLFQNTVAAITGELLLNTQKDYLDGMKVSDLAIHDDHDTEDFATRTKFFFEDVSRASSCAEEPLRQKSSLRNAMTQSPVPAILFLTALWLSAKFWYSRLYQYPLSDYLKKIEEILRRDNHCLATEEKEGHLAVLLEEWVSKNCCLAAKRQEKKKEVSPQSDTTAIFNIMMTHSVDLQWTLVRQNSKFLQKRGGIRLSNDPFNNNGNWTKRQSGFLNDVAAVVKPGKKGAIVVTVKDGKSNNKPKQTFKKTSMAAGVKASAVSKAVAAVRPDLADLTFRRARKLAIINSRTAKVCAARKARSAGIKFARKSVRQNRK